MKKLFTFTALLLIAATLLGQAPASFKYQAVLRDSRGNVKANVTANIKIDILQGSSSGNIVYSENHSVTTNMYGLINLEVGNGVATKGSFSAIDWGTSTYFIKIFVDGVEMGTDQLLSVPYALNAKTADKITGGFKEKDSIFVASPAYGVTSGNITNWSTAYDWGNHATAGYLKASSQNDISNWNTAFGWGNHATAGYLKTYSETDPAFLASPAGGITATNITGWNTALSWGDHASAGYLKSSSENDPIFKAWDKSTGIVITAAQVSDFDANVSNNAAVIQNTAKISYPAADKLKLAGIQDSAEANVNADWNATSGDAKILNKPTIPVGTNPGDMQYWNGTAWVMVPVGSPGQILAVENSNIPSWKNTSMVVMLAPIATIKGATNVQSFSAIINGEVNANGLSSTVSFEWGLTSNYNYSVSSFQSPVYGKTNTSVGYYLTGLQSATTYHYRIKATNSINSVYSRDTTFTTSPSAPKLTTTSVSSILALSATTGGNISHDGGLPVTARGVCYSTSTNPTLADSTSNSGTDTGSFTSNLTGLIRATTYYARAFATNSLGTTYGNEVSFTTSTVLPTITTTAISDTTQTTAKSGGNITDNGGANISSRGVCWSTASNPTTANSRTWDASGTGAFSSSISSLTGNTTYFVRSFAINSAGTGYGNEISFKTRPLLPTVTTDTISAITQTTASSGGNITNDGGAGITARGVCWSNSYSVPTLNNSYSLDSAGIGKYSSNLTDLLKNSTYYVRAYATNKLGTNYGNTVSFTTKVGIPTIATKTITSITANSALSGGNITDNGGSNITERGLCWSKNTLPTISDSIGTYSWGDNFEISITGLLPDSTYYVRAYATNSAGTAYGNELTFTTPKLPSLTTTAISKITHNSAICGGNISSDGGSAITQKGFCWSTSTKPTTENSRSYDGTSMGDFYGFISDLTPNTKYYISAYATTSYGTGYGNEITFTTLSDAPKYNPDLSYGSITDIDGNNYKTIVIGTQTWMAENLQTNKLNDGTPITLITDGNVWNNIDFPAFQGNDKKFGAKYNWVAVNTSKLCPTGWHVPNFTDWTTLTSFLGGESIASKKMKESGTVYWPSPNLGTNESGFTALPNGANDNSGRWWSSTESDNAYIWQLQIYYANIYLTSDTKLAAYPVRCVSGNLTLSTITTTSVSNTTSSSVSSGGIITYDGGSSIAARGVCWSTSSNPTIDSNKTTDGTGTGSFASSVTGLTASTTYYLRAYSTNNLGTAYGNEVTFTTSVLATILTTTSVTSITTTSAISGGNISNEGSSSITSRGVCWNTSANPTIANNKTSDGTGIGSFTSSLTGLTANTTYYVRAYATNSSETTYGAEKSFTTISGSVVTLAELTTTTASSITSTSASSGGNISSGGGAPVIARGICWSSNQNPTTADSKTINGSGLGSFTSSLTNLYPGSTYYFRAYALNSAGTAYGNQETINTPKTPIIYSIEVTSITTTSAACGGRIDSDGGLAITSRGVCWSVSQNPTIADNKTSNGTGTGNFTSSMTDLNSSTTYYVRAYATNIEGTSYGAQKTFTTGFGAVTDVDGNVYSTVQIGTQIWMRENLKVTRYNDNSDIPSVSDGAAWSSLTTPGYCWYDNDAVSNYTTYGALYNWYTVNTGKLCPTGWHVPSDDEWTTLITFAGGESIAGGKLKETGAAHWGGTNTGATNEFIFTALPGGYRSDNFYGINGNGFWWSLTSISTTQSNARNINYYTGSAYHNNSDKTTGMSVRCVKD